MIFLLECLLVILKDDRTMRICVGLVQWWGLNLGAIVNACHFHNEWPSGLYSLRQATEVKLGRVRSDFG